MVDRANLKEIIANLGSEGEVVILPRVDHYGYYQ
jgi:hypothetical protein